MVKLKPCQHQSHNDVGDGMAFLILVQNDDDARSYGSLVSQRHYVTNDVLQCHFSLIFTNSLMMPPLDLHPYNYAI